MEKLILLPLIVVCMTRTAGYGIYTIKEKNMTGAISLFVLTLSAACASVYFLMR